MGYKLGKKTLESPQLSLFNLAHCLTPAERGGCRKRTKRFNRRQKEEGENYFKGVVTQTKDGEKKKALRKGKTSK